MHMAGGLRTLHCVCVTSLLQFAVLSYLLPSQVGTAQYHARSSAVRLQHHHPVTRRRAGDLAASGYIHAVRYKLAFKDARVRVVTEPAYEAYVPARALQEAGRCYCLICALREEEAQTNY